MILRLALLSLATVSALTGCIELPTGGNQPQVIVRHRCGDTNFNELNGTFGKMQGDNGINAKVRVLFETQDGVIRAKWVPGGHERYGVVGVKNDDDHAVFTEPGGGRRFRVWASITDDCRLEAQTGWVDGAGLEERSVEPPQRYAMFKELASRDFEPCTERLYIGREAKSWSAAKASQPPSTPPVVRSSDMEIAAFSSKADVGPGCTARFDVWTDGQAMDARNLDTVEESGDRLRWHTEYTNDYIGLHGIALHRKVSCPGQQETLAGVACISLEVK